MLLKDRLKYEGDFLFTYRSYVPLCFIVFFLVALISFPQYLIIPTHQTSTTHCLFTLFLEGRVGDLMQMEYNDFLVLLALGVGLFGQFIRILVAGYVPKGTSGRNTKSQVANSLNTTGMYSLCRNPLYLGNFFMWCAPLILLGNWLLLFLFILAFWLIYERIIYAEENFLAQKFEENYKEWAENTPCFLPKLSQWKKPNLEFNLSSCIKREYHSLFGLASALLIASYLIGSFTLKDLTILPNPFLTFLFLLSLAFYLTMVCLIKSHLFKTPANR